MRPQCRAPGSQPQQEGTHTHESIPELVSVDSLHRAPVVNPKLELFGAESCPKTVCQEKQSFGNSGILFDWRSFTYSSNKIISKTDWSAKHGKGREFSINCGVRAKLL